MIDWKSLFCMHTWQLLKWTELMHDGGIWGNLFVSRCEKCGKVKQETRQA